MSSNSINTTAVLPIAFQRSVNEKVTIELDGESLTTGRMVVLGNPLSEIEIAVEAMDKVRKGRAVVENIVASGTPTYGVNTGFGPLANKNIPSDKLSDLSRNIVLSHCGGIVDGPQMERNHVRAMMAARINTMIRGHSGVRPEIIDRMVKIFNKGLVPSIPLIGSAGASGDLSPLAHLSNALFFGEGNSKLWDPEEQVYSPAKDVLQKHGFEVPFELQAKEGLALVNGTQQITALGSHIVERAKNAFNHAALATAMSLMAYQGHRAAFEAFPSEVRPQKHQLDVAAFIHNLTAPGMPETASIVQDAYTFRTMPAVYGTALKYILDGAATFDTELCSSNDNPLVDFDNNRIVSAGDFHGQPVAAALDAINLFALKPVLQTSAERTRRLSEGKRDLPTLLVAEPGLHSGFMIHEIALGGIDIPVLAFSAHSIATGLGQEDHISHGPEAAITSLDLLSRTEHALSVELAAATQAIRLRGWDAGTLPPALREPFNAIDEAFPYLDQDRNFSGDIACITEKLRAGELMRPYIS